MPMTATVLATAARHPEQAAIVSPEGRLDYAGLVEDSRSVYGAVSELHAAQSEPPLPAAQTGGIPITAVSVRSAFHAARIVAGLAGHRSVSATLDPQWPLEHRVRVVIATGIGLVVSDDRELASRLTERGWTGSVVSLEEFRDVEARAPKSEAPAVRDGDEAFLLLFSSGTTSAPKAFLKTRRQYRENVAVSSAYLEPLPRVATLAPGPLSYSLTLYALIECLATGGSAHLADRFEAVGLGRRIMDEGISRVVAVPAVVQALADTARRDPTSFQGLDLVVTGGAHLPDSLRGGLAAVLPDARVISYYGAAEIGFIGDSRSGSGSRIALYDGIEARISDVDGNETPPGAPGTLWIRAAACSDGYLPGTTDEVLRGADGWATVHDQARLIDGELELIGRAGDIAITGGHKVALTEVERAFDGIPGLAEVCAVALDHARLGAVVALVIEGAEGAVPAKTDLQEDARQRLAPQFVPSRWYRLDRFPRTVGGKVRRTEVAQAVRDGLAVRL